QHRRLVAPKGRGELRGALPEASARHEIVDDLLRRLVPAAEHHSLGTVDGEPCLSLHECVELLAAVAPPAVLLPAIAELSGMGRLADHDTAALRRSLQDAGLAARSRSRRIGECERAAEWAPAA